MNFFKLYIGDYQRDTAHLSVTEHGAYLLMLQHYYATEAPLPKGKALHRMLRAQDKVERDAIDAVAAQFWTKSDAGLINERADEEIRKAAHQRTVNRVIGKLGGRPRRTESDIKAETESVSESVSEQEPNYNPIQTPDSSESLRRLRDSGVPPPVAAAPEPPDDPRKALWSLGVSILGDGDNSRKLIGRACRDVGEAKVARVLGEMAARPPADPVPYFVAATRDRGVQV